MTGKLELKSCHEVIDTVDVADVDSIFQGKPTDPDILTVVMKDGKRLYCDEVCPIDSLPQEPVSAELIEELKNIVNIRECVLQGVPVIKIACHFAQWKEEQMMAKAVDAGCFGFQGAALFSFRLPSDRYLVGSKVKVIVIKED